MNIEPVEGYTLVQIKQQETTESGLFVTSDTKAAIKAMVVKDKLLPEGSFVILKERPTETSCVEGDFYIVETKNIIAIIK